MLYREIIAVCSESHTKHKYTVGLWTECRVSNAKPGGTHSNHWSLQGSRPGTWAPALLWRSALSSYLFSQLPDYPSINSEITSSFFFVCAHLTAHDMCLLTVTSLRPLVRKLDISKSFHQMAHSNPTDSNVSAVTKEHNTHDECDPITY
jgi:hypothetical protein